jgi:hypothetical protein
LVRRLELYDEPVLQYQPQSRLSADIEGAELEGLCRLFGYGTHGRVITGSEKENCTGQHNETYPQSSLLIHCGPPFSDRTKQIK